MPIRSLPGQRVPFSLRVNGELSNADSFSSRILIANGLPTGIPYSIRNAEDASVLDIPGVYWIELDASSLSHRDQLRFDFEWVLDGVTRRAEVRYSVFDGAVFSSSPVVPVAPVVSVPLTSSVAYVVNSFTGNYGGAYSILSHYIGERLGPNSLTLSPPPVSAANTIGDADGVFSGMTLGGMTRYPMIDQSGGSGSEDALDAILAQPDGTFDYIQYTSGFRQEQEVPGTYDFEVLPGAGGTNPGVFGVHLQVMRDNVSDINGMLVTTPAHILRMTQEGFNANDDSDLTDMERIIRLQVLGARQLEAEGVIATTLPLHYVWSRLMWGAFGSVGSGLSTPVPLYSSLTHQNSQQPGGANLAWLSRSQNDTGFPTNSHQNFIGTLVNVWAEGYALYGINPIGDTTFDFPFIATAASQNFIRPDGARIYGGQAQGAGNLPYDTGVNPGGPPDAELDLPWTSAIRNEIQTRIVAAIDDYYTQATEFD